MQSSAEGKRWLVVVYVILISWIHGSGYTSLQSDVARALCSVAAAWCSSCAGCSCAEDNSMSSPRSPLCSTAALQSTQHTVTTHCRRAAALPPPPGQSCPRRKNSVFCRRIKMRILPRPAVACKICVQSTKLLIRVGEGEECWDQNEDDTPFCADMQAMLIYMFRIIP